MYIAISALVALIGAVVYFIAANSKVAELARLSFFAGFLVFLATVAGHGIRLLS